MFTIFLCSRSLETQGIALKIAKNSLYYNAEVLLQLENTLVTPNFSFKNICADINIKYNMSSLFANIYSYEEIPHLTK